MKYKESEENVFLEQFADGKSITRIKNDKFNFINLCLIKNA